MRRVFGILMLSCAVLFAQDGPVMVNGSGVVISTDQQQVSAASKNRLIALGLSLLVPGGGERYLGYTSRSRMMMATDFSLWLGLGASVYNQNRTFDNLKSYAASYAGNTQLANSYTLLQDMGDWHSRDGYSDVNASLAPGESYNLDQLRAGESIDQILPNTAAYQWDWGDPTNADAAHHFNRYNTLLSQWRASRMITQGFIGALVLDRIISAVDVFVLSRRSQGLILGASPSPNGLYLTISGEF